MFRFLPRSFDYRQVHFLALLAISVTDMKAV